MREPTDLPPLPARDAHASEWEAWETAMAVAADPTEPVQSPPPFRQLLRWLNRMPCGCTRTADQRWVATQCWRHGLLDWLSRRAILVTHDHPHAHYHKGYLEWRPWYWGTAGFLRAFKAGKDRSWGSRGPRPWELAEYGPDGVPPL